MPPLRSPLPWQGGQWDRVSRMLSSGGIPHALLLAGPAGLGKQAFADLLARALMCTSRGDSEIPCGRCGSCILMEAGTHPDSYRLGPDGDRPNILVDQVRSLGHFVALTRNQGPRKVAVMESAERMNASAANSLLKTLEEPPAGTVILLVSDRPGGLPATVRSRCQRIDFRIPPKDLVDRWLGDGGRDPGAELAVSLARGAPLSVRELLEGGAPGRAARIFDGVRDVLSGAKSPVAAARETGETDVTDLLDWLAGWLSDQARECAGAGSPASGRSTAGSPAGRFADFDLESLLGLYDRLVAMKRELHGGRNQELLRENIMLTLSSATHGNRGGLHG